MQKTLDLYYKLFEGKDPLEVEAYLTVCGDSAVRIEYQDIDAILDETDLARHKFYHFTREGVKYVFKDGELIDSYPHDTNEVYFTTTLSKDRLVDKLDLRKNVLGVDYIIDHEGYAKYDNNDVMSYIASVNNKAGLLSKMAALSYKTFSWNRSNSVTLRCFNLFSDKADRSVNGSSDLVYDVENDEVKYSGTVVNQLISYEARLTPKQRKYLMSMGKIIAIRRDHFGEIGKLEAAGIINRIESIDTNLNYGNFKELKFADYYGHVKTKFENVDNYKGVVVCAVAHYNTLTVRILPKLATLVHQDSLRHFLEAGALLLSAEDFQDYLNAQGYSEQTRADSLSSDLCKWDNNRNRINAIKDIRNEIKQVHERIQSNTSVSA